MKRNISYLIVVLFFTACSSSKHTYHFSEYDYQSGKKNADMTELKGLKKKTSIGSSFTENLTQSEDLTAAMPGHVKIIARTNNLKPHSLLPNEAPASKNLKSSSSERKISKKEARQELRTGIKALREEWQENEIKDGTKNGLAIAGFVCSIVGLFVLWPLCILGIIFSAIGLKSERKGLAIAGLIIGIIGVVLVIAAGAALAA